MATKVILLVEDNPDDEALVMRSLRKANIANEVVIAHDGVEAIDYLYSPETTNDPGRLPALVLLDLKMPRLGGFEVLERIRSDPSTRFLPVVILTSSSEDEDMARSYMGGANSYVRKPVDFTEFANAVQKLGIYWLLLNSVPKTE